MTDTAGEAWYDRLSKTCVGYLNSVLEGNPSGWMRGQGYNEEYINLGLSHEDVINDIISGDTIAVSRDILECGACGRLLLEFAENQFTYFTPDRDDPRGLFREDGEISSA